MSVQQDRAHDGGHWSMSLLGLVAFGAIFLFSGWQTAQFVWTLFPNDQLTYRFLGVSMIDGMYLVCLLFIIFYKFRDDRSHTIIQWTRGITFTLSLIATGIYLFFFNGKTINFIDPQWVNVGKIVIVLATMFGVLASSFVLQFEIEPSHKPKVVRTTQVVQEWKTPEPEILQPAQTVQLAQNTGPIQTVSARTEKHPRNCYCTSCRPANVRTS